jgi:hypothetical protein
MKTKMTLTEISNKMDSIQKRLRLKHTPRYHARLARQFMELSTMFYAKAKISG